MHKIKITEKGWGGYNGSLCQVEFVDGISVHPVLQVMADRVASIVQCEVLDEDGNHAGQAGYAARHPAGMTIGAPLAALEVMTQQQLDDEREAAIKRALTNPASKLYTAQELEAIASARGINGLRQDVGDKWGVKERSIAKLIILILEAQDEYRVRAADHAAVAEKAQKEAAAEAIAKATADRAAFDAQCRAVLNKDDTTATVDPAKVPTNEWDGFEQDPLKNFAEAITADPGENKDAA